MDQRALRDLFAPLGAIDLKRMFGGHGIYAEGRIFAIEADGEIFLKCDAENRAAFEALGMRPFTYEKGAGQQAVMSYRALPEDAYDDPALLIRLARLAIAAGLRAPAKPASQRRMKPGK
jgi:DNA transformation protein